MIEKNPEKDQLDKIKEAELKQKKDEKRKLTAQRASTGRSAMSTSYLEQSAEEELQYDTTSLAAIKRKAMSSKSLPVKSNARDIDEQEFDYDFEDEDEDEDENDSFIAGEGSEVR